jgi:hypothetical protein
VIFVRDNRAEMSVPYVPEDEDLEHQLAHVDGLERPAGERRLEAASDAGRGIKPLAVQPRWPRGVPSPPPAGSSGTSLAPYIGWLDFACTIIEARVETNEGELERLRSQWVHVVSNLDRLRPEEIDAVVESQARVRESIANDAALHEVLRTQREQLTSWGEALASPLTDPALVRRLLDDVVEERARIAQAVTTSIVDSLTTLLLDMEIVERRVARDPGSAAGLLQGLRERVAGSAARVRDQPYADDVLPILPGEPLQRALRRIAERYAGRVATEAQWSGVEACEPDVSLAVASVVQECLVHLSRIQGSSCVVSVEAGAQGVSMRVATASAALLPDGEPSWLVRARARAALAGGRLLCGRAGEGSVVEVRFQ